MALAERLADHDADSSDELCSLGKLLTELQGDELAALKAMLGTAKHRGWTAPDIYEALKGEGFAVGFKAINKHRGETCRCKR